MSDNRRDDRPPFDLHAAVQAHAAAGFTRPLQLQSRQAASLARSLRGIDAVASVLSAETGEDCSDTALILGDYLRSGLLEAIGAMATNAGELLEVINDQTKAAQADGR